MRKGGLATICEKARCPNIGECWGRAPRCSRSSETRARGPAATRRRLGKPEEPPYLLEPLRRAETAAQMGLEHVAATSVDSDEIPDRGAAHYAAMIGRSGGSFGRPTSRS